MKKLFILIAVLAAAACTGNKSASPAGKNTGTITGTLANSRGPLQNAEVLLKVYKDENCMKLGKQQNLSPEQDAQFKQCRQQVSTSNSDAQGKYSFANVADGWYDITVNWITRDDPLPANPMWKPLFLYREADFLITFIAAKDGSFHMLAVGEPFQFQGGSTEKSLTLKL